MVTTSLTAEIHCQNILESAIEPEPLAGKIKKSRKSEDRTRRLSKRLR